MSTIVTSMEHDPDGRLTQEKVAIVGVGGTGSHILDFISRMPIAKIHLFDGENLTRRNTSRSPGVVEVPTTGGETENKANVYAARYANLNPNIRGFAQCIDESNVHMLARYTTIFLSIDGGNIKRRIVELCIANGIVLINVGMGVLKGQNDQLMGLVGVTMCLSNAHEHVHQCFGLNEPVKLDDNHQTIELNALNAAIAVIRWKKHLGIYSDTSRMLDVCYSIESNTLYNEFDEP